MSDPIRTRQPEAEAEAQPRLGAHMSIAGGITNAVRRGVAAGCETLSVFSGSPRVWRRRFPDDEEIDRYHSQVSSAKIHPVVLHALYLANPASSDAAIRSRSMEAILFELHVADLLGIEWVVLHPGSHGGKGAREGVVQCSRFLDELFARSTALAGVALETVAGSGDAVGATFQELRDIMDTCRSSDRLSVCIDTCHIFAAGYDIRSRTDWSHTTGEFDRIIGLDRVTALHLNDSAKPLGSAVDRHTHIGEGAIGLEGFRAVVNDPRLTHVPMILETPKGSNDRLDEKNLRTLRSLLRSSRADRA